jgi:peptide/nickel transport system ATP-binding protein
MVATPSATAESAERGGHRPGNVRAGAPVLKIENLAISYQTRRGDVDAVRDVSLKIEPGQALGLVGESGCGKSTVALGIVTFLGNGRIVDGNILFQGQDLRDCSEEQMRRLRGNQISMVYQDPSQALNPSLRIRDQLSEVLTFHQGLGKKEAYEKSLHMLRRVHMPDPEVVMTRYAHQLSGGQQQRVVIAMALLNNPALLIMDEPTTALDVTIEATVLDLVTGLREEFDTAILYITHNLGVIARISDRVGVMYAGEMVERASVQDVFLRPMHPYTLGLMRCVPKLGTSKVSSYLSPIPGRVPSPRELPPGCVFEPRCGYARDICRQTSPEMRQVAPGRFVRCHFAEEVAQAGWRPREDLIAQLCQPLEYGSEVVPILSLDQAKTYYKQTSSSLAGLVGLGERQYVKAVDDVSIDVPKTCTLGVVGESGCGKSTLAKTIVGLEQLTGGEIRCLDVDISVPVEKRDTKIIKELQMVFQNPDSTMNPSFSVGYQVARPLRRFKTVPPQRVREEVVRLLNVVKLDASYYYRLPRQLSGGEKQRVAIARAFAARPDLVLCDEPVSSLDVSVQAAVLNLLLEIQRDYGTTLVFITHDLSVVRFFCDAIAVMYLGKLCEVGPAEAVYAPPYHPYTEALLSAVPIPDPTASQKHIRLSGSVPSALTPPSGCRFHTRCPRKVGEICETKEPPWQEAEGGHRICCHIPLAELRLVDAVITVEQ